MFTAQDVKSLREKTGVGMMDCKKALTETNGDMEKAIEYLREKGMSAAAKKAGRIAAEGIVTSYIHSNGKIGVLLEVNCETDFVAKNEAFVDFCHDIAMQIAAAKPEVVRIEDLSEEAVNKEREIYKAQVLNEGKPEAVADKIVEGKIKKYYKDVVLMEQDFVKDSTKTISQLLNETVLKTGEKITIRRFTRYEMGEGLEKRKDNFAEEVMAQTKTKKD
ncbi:MAG: translation elongation factor Ts [Christensenellales bacterium]